MTIAEYLRSETERNREILEIERNRVLQQIAVLTLARKSIELIESIETEIEIESIEMQEAADCATFCGF